VEHTVRENRISSTEFYLADLMDSELDPLLMPALKDCGCGVD
jgi:hypothetical protein